MIKIPQVICDLREKTDRICIDIECNLKKAEERQCRKDHFKSEDFEDGLSFQEFVDTIRFEEHKGYRPNVDGEVILQEGEITRTEENKYRLEYLPLTITKSSNNGRRADNDKLKRFVQKEDEKEATISENTLLASLKKEFISTLYCITSYSEYGNQLLQSLMGSVRSIAELCHNNPESFTYNQFGIVVVCDGIDKVNDSFTKLLMKYNLVDPYMFVDMLITEDQGKYIKKKFKKFNKEKDGKYKVESKFKYSYTSTNMAHVFCKKIPWSDLKELLDEKDPDGKNPNRFLCNYHDGSIAPSEYVLKGIEEIKKEDGEIIENLPEINFFVVLKHENAGKIDSHQWFFKGFCNYLNPQFCQMIDIGTIPLKNSISKIIKQMIADESIGGACGEIEVFDPTLKELGLEPSKFNSENKRGCKNTALTCIKYGANKFSDLVWWLEKKSLIYAQYAEYKLSHYLDKAAESSCGFVSVLPGAFSAFRWEAIKGNPLKKFFKGLDKSTHSAEEANMYLAEDRIMCLEILVKHSEKYLLRYIPGAKGLTDPPISIIELIKQRRRWINGSLFASYYVISHMSTVSKSRHSFLRRMIFYMLIFFMLIQFVFSLLLVGSLFSTYAMFINSYYGQNEDCHFSLSQPQNLLIRLYWVILFIFIIFSVTKPIERSQWVYRGIVIFFGVLVLGVMGLGIRSVFIAIKDTSAYISYFVVGVTAGVYIIPPLLNFECSWQILKLPFGLICLTFYTPLYVNIFLTYSIANLHDVSWGTRAISQDKQNDTQKNLEQFRATNLILWLFVNAVFGYGTLYLQTSGQTTFLIIFSLMVTITLFIKLILCTWFTLDACVTWSDMKLRGKKLIKTNFGKWVSDQTDIRKKEQEELDELRRKRSQNQADLENGQNRGSTDSEE